MVGIHKNISHGIIKKLNSILAECTLCPRNCRVNRVKGEKGFCRAGLKPAVYSHFVHHGEEPPISAHNGSGTIFFTHCNMQCVYCQNYNFSQMSDEKEITVEELAKIMLGLEKSKCHNINLVSPTHYVPQIVEALSLAYEKGLRLPVVYNTGAYDSIDVIKLLGGIVDIYLPDMRYNTDEMALEYSNASAYVENNRKVILEMYKQAGDLVLDKDGVGIKGLIIRCLMLPNQVSGTDKILEFIAEKISKKTHISLMSQYYPAHKAMAYEKISRRITDDEYMQVVGRVNELGLTNGWIQEPPSHMDETLGGHRIKPK